MTPAKPKENGGEWNLSGGEDTPKSKKVSANSHSLKSNENPNRLSIAVSETSQGKASQPSPRLGEVDKLCADQFLKEAFDEANENDLNDSVLHTK